MSEKRTTKNLKRLQAAFSVEISLTMAMVTVGAILILALFGRSLATALLQNSFFEHFTQKPDVATTLVNNNNNTNFTPTQINVALTASQGIKFKSEDDAKDWSKTTISDVLDMATPAQNDLEALAKATAIADVYADNDYKLKGEISKIKQLVSKEKYGKIKVDSDVDGIIISLNSQKIVLKKISLDNLALFNAIYNAKFE